MFQGCGPEFGFGHIRTVWCNHTTLVEVIAARSWKFCAKRGVESWVRLVWNTCAQLQEPQLLMEPAGCWRLNSERCGDGLKPGTSHRRPLLRGATIGSKSHSPGLVRCRTWQEHLFLPRLLQALSQLKLSLLSHSYVLRQVIRSGPSLFWFCGGVARCCDVGQTSCTYT